jgi:23S rRNA pseudouridine1911/1915/1917 synthase
MCCVLEWPSVEAIDMTSTNTSERRLTVSASPDDSGQRLDRWLAGKLPQFSRARLQALIRAGAVEIEDGRAAGTISDVGSPVKPGAVYFVTPPDAAEPDAAGEPLPLTVVHEDRDVIVIDKPAGLVVHPAAGHGSGTLVNALIAHCGESLSGIGGVKRPGIVHRLDKNTSGLLVVAKNDDAHRNLSEQFKSHGEDGRLHRAYLALAWGAPVRRKGVIDAPLQRSAVNRTKIAVARGDFGRRAVTRYEKLESFLDAEGKSDVASLLRLELETGRTHQIRVHLAHIGHPILGDATYGAGHRTRAQRLPEEARARVEGLSRQVLHAAELGFEHPRTGKKMIFVSDLPVDIGDILASLRKSAPDRHRRK